ncbi:hypothetical protein [Paenibacillus hexagrammi]|uniref:Core-binding (CB) domain-containing protein n=1 Tax=Paenibacillus hexagrammi TaxID=2908839 RepID=A0ABY3SFZ4_9BACL|nr:hypothetical protein [Paenibacillus sp. YPD9-1]UJF32169.1 hypothetical protein L0M14_20915 [Paenibacillus sp. YPD9-1]
MLDADLNNIIRINQFRFFTDVMWLDWNGGRKQFAVISLAKKIHCNPIDEDNSNIRCEVKVIHPVSEFIISRYYFREYATMKKHSDNLIGFLNYIIKNRKALNITAFTDLKLSHGTKFLNYLGSEKKVSRGTVKLYERTLTNFYAFLSDKGLLNEVPKNKLIRKQDQWGKKFYESPFAGVIYPSYKLSKKEHAFPLKYFPLLLEIAIQELFMDKDISIWLNTILFSSLLYVDPRTAVETFLQTSAKRHSLRSPDTFTNRKSMKKALDYIAVGLNSGSIVYSRRLAQLILLLLSASIEKTIEIFHALGLEDKAELKFKVSLLTPICHKMPGVGLLIIRELLARGDIPGNIRLSLYTVLSVIRGGYIPDALELVEYLRRVETHPSGIRRLDRVLQNLYRAEKISKAGSGVDYISTNGMG